MRPDEISSDNPIAIAVAGTAAIQRLDPWHRASAIAIVLTSLPEAAVKLQPWKLNNKVEELLSIQFEKDNIANFRRLVRHGIIGC